MMNDKTQAVIHKALAHSRGCVIGEYHTDRSSLAFLIDHLPEMARQGVKVIGLEGYTDKHDADFEYFRQHGVDRILASVEKEPGTTASIMRSADIHYAMGDLPRYNHYEYSRHVHNLHFQEFFNLASKDQTNPIFRQINAFIEHAGKQEYSFDRLLRTARENGVRLVGIDYHTSDEELTRLFGCENRLEKMNNHAIETIERKAQPGEKFVLFTGRSHGVTTRGQKGLSEMLGIPSIAINASKNHSIEILEKSAQTAATSPGYDYVISYPRKSVGTPERVLPEANWFSALPKKGRLLIGGSAVATVAGVTGLSYYYYQHLHKQQAEKKENPTPKTQLAKEQMPVVASKMVTAAQTQSANVAL